MLIMLKQLSLRVIFKSFQTIQIFYHARSSGLKAEKKSVSSKTFIKHSTQALIQAHSQPVYGAAEQ